MKTASINAFGSPDAVVIGQRPVRATNPDEVLVRVQAASVNPLDVKMIAGHMRQVFPAELPYVPGTDFSGVIESVGAEVTAVKPGDRVVGRTTPNAGGAFAQTVVVAVDDVCIIPADMSAEQLVKEGCLWAIHQCNPEQCQAEGQCDQEGHFTIDQPEDGKGHQA